LGPPAMPALRGAPLFRRAENFSPPGFVSTNVRARIAEMKLVLTEEA